MLKDLHQRDRRQPCHLSPKWKRSIWFQLLVIREPAISSAMMRNMTQQRFIDFMERLVQDTDRKVLFIVNNLKVHHGKIVAEWLSEHKDVIELFVTSPYSLKSIQMNI